MKLSYKRWYIFMIFYTIKDDTWLLTISGGGIIWNIMRWSRWQEDCITFSCGAILPGSSGRRGSRNTLTHCTARELKMKFDHSDHFDKNHLLSDVDHVSPPHKPMTLSKNLHCIHCFHRLQCLHFLPLKSVYTVICRVFFFTGPLDFQYQDEKNLLSQRGAFLHWKFLEKLVLVGCNLFFILVLKIEKNS